MAYPARRLAASVFTLTAILGAAAPATAGSNFLTSREYRDDDEVVGKMLVDADYRKMVEDLQFHKVEFDWGWVKATGRKPSHPQALGFDIAAYHRVFIAPVTNPTLEVVPGLTDDVRELFGEALAQLGLEPTKSAKNADLELDIAVVDYNPESIYVYFAWIDPFIELEIRLRDARTGEDLLLIRHQDHGATPLHGAADTATDLARFLG
jgi:hypothetical protein